MFKLYKASFNTAHITTDDIRKIYNFGMPSDEVLELQAEARRNINGITLHVSEWDYAPGNFSLMGWDDEDDEKMKELMWSIEQAEGFYYNDRQRFNNDWAKNEYDPGGALHFSKELFTNVEFVKEFF